MLVEGYLKLPSPNIKVSVLPPGQIYNLGISMNILGAQTGGLNKADTLEF